MKNKKNNQLKASNGITLIALVITIIVLLILAGVTIATLTGKNGILTKATEAEEETSYEGAREKLNLILTDLQAEKIPKGESLILEDALAGEIAAYDEVTSATFTGDVIEVVIDGYTFEVNADLGIEKQIDKVEPDNLDDWEYIVEDDGTAMLTCYKGADTTVVVPNYINGYWVKKIGTNDKTGNGFDSLWGEEICTYKQSYDAYYDAHIQETITEIIISDGIEVIEDSAFIYTNNLQRIEIPRSVQEIKFRAIALEVLTTEAAENNQLLEINIYKNVTTLGGDVFRGRNNLNINVEYEEDQIPETWNQYWNVEGCNVSYGVKMD